MSKRENMRINPSHKHFHSYQNFSGGLNTVDADEKIGDSELANLTNIDIGERGSLKRRTGFENVYYPKVFWSNIGHKKWSEL